MTLVQMGEKVSPNFTPDSVPLALKSNTTTLGSQRYRILEKIGSGGMGIVYSAFDRLNNQQIALKRVLLQPNKLDFTSRAASSPDGYVALAHEFRILASLRHPHIVSVLDYGFGQSRQPYFTMELLKSPQSILDGGQDQALDIKIDLLAQLIRALAYLHRRGILHRDLKPTNVLVSAGVVKLVDFGLSAAVDESRGTVGTLAYIAPEVLQGEPPTMTSDLYAVGVIAYEIFARRHPFGSGEQMVTRVLTDEPDMEALGVNENLAQVIYTLLAKDPQDRYADSNALMKALREATGLPLTLETQATRESFLQAAPLIGRENEIAELSEALKEAIEGLGSTCLIAGESGVGKSRLAGEVRTLALIKGMLAITVQTTGNAVYQAWQDVLRRLVLAVDLSDLEANVLKIVVPDIGTLLRRRVTDSPQLEPGSAQVRLFTTIVDIVKRLQQPLLVILEDVHLADEGSLSLLAWLTQFSRDLPLLIVCTYRDDERSNLPIQVPGASLIKLARLSDESIEALVTSMLGTVGNRGPVIDLLRRETEGNAFFVVEVVRALAEEAGQLDRIGTGTLPEHVFTGGMQQIIQRRLNRAPSEALPILKLAAVAGRVLDTNVLQALNPSSDVTDWLRACADVAVLDVFEDRWQFSHDKLREGLLDTLDSATRQAAHEQIGRVIEAIYAEELAPHYADLAFHFGGAQNPEKERQYAALAGEQAAAQFSNAAAVAYFARALELMPEADHSSRFSLLRMQERVYTLQGAWEAQRHNLSLMNDLAELHNDDGRRAEVALRLAEHNLTISNWPGTLESVLRAVELCRRIRYMEGEIRARRFWANVLFRQADYAGALQQYQYMQAMIMAWEEGLSPYKGQTLHGYGVTVYEMGDRQKGIQLLEAALQVFRETGNRLWEGNVLYDLGTLASAYDTTIAKSYLDGALRIFRETGNRRAEGWLLGALANVEYQLAEFADAFRHAEETITLNRKFHSRTGEAWGFSIMGRLLSDCGEFPTAQSNLETALDIFRELNDPQGVATTLGNLSELFYLWDQHATAYDYAQQQLKIAQEMRLIMLQSIAFFYIANALTGQGRYEEALEAYHKALRGEREAARVEVIAQLLAMMTEPLLKLNRLDEAKQGVEEICLHEKNVRLFPWIYMKCYNVLKVSDDEHARDFLVKAANMLERQVAKLPDDNMRKVYLENNPLHREIMTAWYDA